MLNFDSEMKTLYPIVLIPLISFHAAYPNPSIINDSSEVIKKQKTYALKLTTRLNSMGMFSFGGRLVSNNPAADFNFTYDRKEFGFMFYKAADLYNQHSDNNFSFALLYHHFKFGNRLTFSPGIGFIIDQTQKVLGNKGSDVTLNITTSYKINSKLIVDHTAVMPNMMLESSDRDWINRFRLLYSHKHLDMTLMAWHNNRVFNHTEYVTSGFNVTYARVAINDHIFLNTGITAVYMPYSNDQDEFPKKNGLVFTVATILH
jgi:hypothetical protein